MTPFTFIPLVIRIASTLNRTVPPTAPETVVEPSPVKRGKKTTVAVVAPIVMKKKVWTPLFVGLATGVMIGAGLYSGNLDGSAALSLASSIDFSGILALFGN